MIPASRVLMGAACCPSQPRLNAGIIVQGPLSMGANSCRSNTLLRGERFQRLIMKTNRSIIVFKRAVPNGPR